MTNTPCARLPSHLNRPYYTPHEDTCHIALYIQMVTNYQLIARVVYRVLYIMKPNLIYSRNNGFWVLDT